jgi:mRNA-decapping enzyme subunit 2
MPCGGIYYFTWLWICDNSYGGYCTGTVWKAKNPSGVTVPVENPAIYRAVSDPQQVDNRPGKSFRNFRFDTASILQSMEASFLQT